MGIARPLALQQHRMMVLTLAGIGVAFSAAVTACGERADDAPIAPSPQAAAFGQSTPSPERDTSAAPSSPTDISPVITASVERTQVPLDDALIERAREEGDLSVIVTLAIPYRPEAELANQAEVEAQRRAIAAAQDALVASITDGTVDVTTRMTLLPQLVLRVDERALRQIAQSPLVLAINQDTFSAPTS